MDGTRAHAEHSHIPQASNISRPPTSSHLKSQSLQIHDTPSVKLTVPTDDGVATESRNPTTIPDDIHRAETFPQTAHEYKRRSRTNSSVMMDERQGQMKIRWEQAWQKQSANVDEYNRVGVLLIRWSNELDDLETEKECRELERIFKEQFNYATELLELQAKPTPHIQILEAMLRLVKEYDDPSQKNLVIIYYSGHGWYRKDINEFYLSPTKDGSIPGGGSVLAPGWHAAEGCLQDLHSDVLTIFDTCLAANLMKTELYHTNQNSIFEQITASGIDRDTPKPGKESFTSDLINVFRELLKDPNARFSTYFLCHKLWQRRPHHNIPIPWNRYGVDAPHIYLKPLLKHKEPPTASDGEVNKVTSQLALDFELERSELTDDDIESLSREVAQAVSHLPFNVPRVEWRGIRQRKDPRMGFFEVAQFFNQAKAMKRRFSRASSIGHFNTPISPTEHYGYEAGEAGMSQLSSSPRKRKQSAADAFADGTHAYSGSHDSDSSSSNHPDGPDSRRYLHPFDGVHQA